MIKEKKDKLPKFRPFCRARVILDRHKYFNLHIPISLSNLLELKPHDIVQIFVSTQERAFFVKVLAEE